MPEGVLLVEPNDFEIGFIRIFLFSHTIDSQLQVKKLGLFSCARRTRVKDR